MLIRAAPILVKVQVGLCLVDFLHLRRFVSNGGLGAELDERRTRNRHSLTLRERTALENGAIWLLLFDALPAKRARARAAPDPRPLASPAR